MRVAGYPERRAIRSGVSRNLAFDGAPAEGWYADKLGFHTTGYSELPPTLVKEIRYASPEGKSVRPSAFSLTSLEPHEFPRVLLESEDKSVKIVALVLGSQPLGSSLMRSKRMINADGDQVWYVHQGELLFFSSFGVLKVHEGDYLLVPRLVPWSVHVLNPFVAMIGMESRHPLLRPDLGEYVNKDIPYQVHRIRVPEPEDAELDPADAAGEWGVYLKRGDRLTIQVFPHSPFSRIAWSGTVYPFALNTADINTVATPTMHTDPSLFATFATEDGSAMISTFRPRWAHSLPYHHMNHYDEALFYASGYAARGGRVGPGDCTFHPQGFYHGPQVEALMSWERPSCPENAPWVDEHLVMFESRSFLSPTAVAEKIEKHGYWKSWYEGWIKSPNSH